MTQQELVVCQLLIKIVRLMGSVNRATT